MAEAVDVRLARIEEKLDQILQKDDDHEKRIRFLERAMWVAMVAAGALGGAIRDLFPAIGGN